MLWPNSANHRIFTACCWILRILGKTSYSEFCFVWILALWRLLSGNKKKKKKNLKRQFSIYCITMPSILVRSKCLWTFGGSQAVATMPSNNILTLTQYPPSRLIQRGCLRSAANTQSHYSISHAPPPLNQQMVSLHNYATSGVKSSQSHWMLF